MESITTPEPSISIMVVEDEAITLKFLVTTLAKKYPYVTLYSALNGRTGLELFITHTADIVITDINMPEMGGMQMAEKMSVIKADTRFIVLTGYAAKLSLEASVGSGFEIDHYIAKPVDFQDLFEAIEQCFSAISHGLPPNTNNR